MKFALLLFVLAQKLKAAAKKNPAHDVYQRYMKQLDKSQGNGDTGLPGK